jgi:hypothetical protein
VRCPECGQSEAFTEVLTHCTVTRVVNGDGEHVETLDWEPTGDTVRTYYCPCGARFSEGDLDDF